MKDKQIAHVLNIMISHVFRQKERCLVRYDSIKKSLILGLQAEFENGNHYAFLEMKSIPLDKYQFDYLLNVGLLTTKQSNTYNFVYTCPKSFEWLEKYNEGKFLSKLKNQVFIWALSFFLGMLAQYLVTQYQEIIDFAKALL